VAVAGVSKLTATQLFYSYYFQTAVACAVAIIIAVNNIVRFREQVTLLSIFYEKKYFFVKNFLTYFFCEWLKI